MEGQSDPVRKSPEQEFKEDLAARLAGTKLVERDIAAAVQAIQRLPGMLESQERMLENILEELRKR